jgi:hypothetical protein
MSIDPRTPAEIAYDAARLSPAWEAVLDITADDTNDGRDHTAVIEILEAIDGGDDDDECKPIPSVPAGYAPDRPFLAHKHGDVGIYMDRRDGGLIVARKDEIGARLLERDEVYALWQFLDERAVQEVIMYHWREWVRANGDPLLRELVDHIDRHMASKQ